MFESQTIVAKNATVVSVGLHICDELYVLSNTYTQNWMLTLFDPINITELNFHALFKIS